MPPPVAGGYVTVAPHKPGVLFAVIFAGQVIVGGPVHVSVALVPKSGEIVRYVVAHAPELNE